MVPELLTVSRGGEWSGVYQGRKILGILGGTEQHRMSLGFYHPNELHRCVFTITALIVCIYIKRLKGWGLLLLFLLNLATYLLTFSNTALVVGTFFFFMILCDRKYKGMEVWVSKNSKVIFLVTVLFIILACLLYSTDNSVLEMVNNLLTGRVRWAHEYSKAVKLSLWGRNIENVQVPYKGLDCGYVHVLLRYGVVVLVVYCLCVYRLLEKMHENGLYIEAFFILSLQLYFVMENFLLIAFQNYTWLYLGCILFYGDCDGEGVKLEKLCTKSNIRANIKRGL